jgi:hypothetical protein
VVNLLQRGEVNGTGFSIKPDPDFVEIHAGGGACGIRLSSYEQLPLLVENLKRVTERDLDLH